MAEHISRNIDKKWVISQLEEAEIRDPLVRTEVARILDAWEGIGTTVDPDVAQKALSLVSRLALGHSLVEPKTDEEEVWVDVIPGQIKVADTVRIKAEAFSGKTGQIHNGRVGKIVAIRYGDIIFKSTDNKNPVLDGTHYSPYNLEKRIK
jgi:hypothetical protein